MSRNDARRDVGDDADVLSIATLSKRVSVSSASPPPPTMSSNISYGSNAFGIARDTGGFRVGATFAVVVSPTLALETFVSRVRPLAAAAGSSRRRQRLGASPISVTDPNDPRARGGGANVKSSNDAEFVRPRSRISDNGLISIMIFSSPRSTARLARVFIVRTLPSLALVRVKVPRRRHDDDGRRLSRASSKPLARASPLGRALRPINGSRRLEPFGERHASLTRDVAVETARAFARVNPRVRAFLRPRVETNATRARARRRECGECPDRVKISRRDAAGERENDGEDDDETRSRGCVHA